MQDKHQLLRPHRYGGRTSMPNEREFDFQRPPNGEVLIDFNADSDADNEKCIEKNNSFV
jgi:hypothetical protein